MSGAVRLVQEQKMKSWLTTLEIAVLPGIGLKTVGNWARAGRLCSKRGGTSPKARWLFEPVDQQPEPVRRRVAARAIMKRHRDILSDAAAGRGAV